jgi:pimeloyl-ACP methyl ester carboxylesterase
MLPLVHHTASVNGVRLHYVMGGQGEPLVLLHGFPQTWYSWHKVMPALAEQYTVIAPDLRGYGDSSKPRDGYDKKTMAEDIYQLVNKLGYEQIFLVGHDVGGMVAYAYACTYPTGVRRLAIAEALIAGLKPGFEEAMDNSQGQGAWWVTFNTVPNLPEALIAGRERIYIDWFCKNVAYNPASISESDIDEYVRAFSTPGTMRAIFESYRAIFQDVEDNKKQSQIKLKMPVLALGGGSGVSVGDRLYRSLIPVTEDLRSVSIDRCGHWLPEEQPEEFSQHLLSFLNEE